jgi:hypothetical protein
LKETFCEWRKKEKEKIGFHQNLVKRAGKATYQSTYNRWNTVAPANPNHAETTGRENRQKLSTVKNLVPPSPSLIKPALSFTNHTTHLYTEPAQR